MLPFQAMREIIVGELLKAGIPSWMVPTYWFMLTLAIVAGALLSLRLARKTGLQAPVSDLLFFGIIGLFAGAKVVYGLQYWRSWNWENFLQPAGFALYGGLIGLLAAWLVYYWIRPYPLLGFLDCITPGLAFGLFLGRIGCFLAGCNGGIVCGLPWAVRFPPGTSSYDYQLANKLIDSDALRALPAHPTQLYESLFGLAAFFLLLHLLRDRRWEGEIFLTGMAWYALFRFPAEWLRADGGGSHPFGIFTFAQFISLLLFLGTLIVYFNLARRATTGNAD